MVNQINKNNYTKTKQVSTAHPLLLHTRGLEHVCVVLFQVISQTDWWYRCLGTLSHLMNIQDIMNINILKMESYKCIVQFAIVTGTNCLSMQRCAHTPLLTSFFSIIIIKPFHELSWPIKTEGQYVCVCI